MAPEVVTVNILVLAAERKSKAIVCKGFVAIVQSLTHVRLFETSRAAAHQAPLSFTISLSLLKFMSIESVTLSNHLILCCLFFLLPSIFPSIKVFSNESAYLHQVAKVLALQL